MKVMNKKMIDRSTWKLLSCMVAILCMAGTYASQNNVGEPSLFLRAGKSTAIKGNDKERNFIIGKDSSEKPLIEKGSSMIVADPTYDLTFKKLFKENPDLLRSLLNSLFYPKCSLRRYDDVMIRKVEILDGEQIKEKSLDDEEGEEEKTRSETGNSLQRYICDIACKCTVNSKNGNEKNDLYLLYFDVEMQRERKEGQEMRFFNYAQRMKEQYDGEVRSVAFLGDVFPKDNVSESYSLEIVRGELSIGGDFSENVSEKKIDWCPTISLKAASGQIISGEDFGKKCF